MPESARSRNVLGSAFLAELKDLFGDKVDFSEELGMDKRWLNSNFKKKIKNHKFVKKIINLDLLLFNLLENIEQVVYSRKYPKSRMSRSRKTQKWRQLVRR